jgi:hypothetical protein
MSTVNVANIQSISHFCYPLLITITIPVDSHTFSINQVDALSPERFLLHWEHS